MKKIITGGCIAACALFFISGPVSAASFPPLAEATAALQSDAEVTVTTITVPEWPVESNFYYAFEPTAPGPAIGFIIYPGALIDPSSYAPAAHEIARRGFPSFIVKMINDVAIGESVQRATRVMNDHPGIAKWAIGGHSMGGFGACAYTKGHADIIGGVILWGAYPSEYARIDDKIVRAVSIYGTNDGLTTLDEIEVSRLHLPPYAQFVAIAGGNHTQFGWYDTSPDPVQPDDNPATITRQEQQDQQVQASADFLNSINLCPNDPHSDYDMDSVCGEVDNCPYSPNPEQQDSYPPQRNLCGDLCEAEGNFDGDQDVDGSDASTFKADFGRSAFKDPCTNLAPCKGDFTCDVDVDGSDAALFKSDFGRSSFKNPAPNCVTVPWCVYP